MHANEVQPGENKDRQVDRIVTGNVFVLVNEVELMCNLWKLKEGKVQMIGFISYLNRCSDFGDCQS